MPIDLNEHLKRKNANQNNNQNNNKNSSGGSGGGFTPKMPNLPDRLSGKVIALISALVLVFLLFIIQPFVIINSGDVGIKVTAGKYDKEPLWPGIHFFVPIIQKVFIVDTRVRTINFSSAENLGTMGKNQGIFRANPISVMDSRGLPVLIELTVQYKLNANNAPETIKTYGASWEQKIINPVVLDVVRNVIGGYTAEELPVKRNEIAELISQNIKNNIEKLQNNPVELSSVQLRDIILPENIRIQIEKVQIARQEAQRVEYEVERAKKEAQKVAELAKGEADANRIKAKGIADAVLIESQANAKSNKEISASLTPALLQLKSIQSKEKFNDALRVNPNAQIFLLPGGVTPNIFMDAPKIGKSVSAKVTQ